MSYQPPPGPPPEKTGYRLFPSDPTSGSGSGSGSGAEYQPPPGPPPNYASDSTYQPPPGPPPGHKAADHSAPGSTEDAPPPYHDWTIIPDTSQLPPPPSIAHDFSSGANATIEDADRARLWCYHNPLWTPRQLLPQQLDAIHRNAHVLVRPPSFHGEFKQGRSGAWVCQTQATATDTLIQTTLPVYSALADSPLVTERAKTIYFEVMISRLGEPKKKQQQQKQKHHFFSHHQEENIDAGLALGFFAPPYPPFRLPGWQRGSLGVHSDDGRRYVNDTHGGIDFVAPFKEGQVVGLGMTFRIPAQGQAGQNADVEVFFTRDGVKEGTWNLYEERDGLVAKDAPEGVLGLEGGHDLFPAVGVFGAAEWEIRFNAQEWLFRPRG